MKVRGKGDGGEQTTLTMPPPLKAAMAAWIAVRGNLPGPLFLNADRARSAPTRLSTEGIANVVRICGGTTMRVRPHGLRHSAITEALDLTKGDLRAVQRFSRQRAAPVHAPARRLGRQRQPPAVVQLEVNEPRDHGPVVLGLRHAPGPGALPRRRPGALPRRRLAAGHRVEQLRSSPLHTSSAETTRSGPREHTRISPRASAQTCS